MKSENGSKNSVASAVGFGIATMKTTTAMRIATSMPDIRHMLSHNWDAAIEPTGNYEP